MTIKPSNSDDDVKTQNQNSRVKDLLRAQAIQNKAIGVDGQIISSDLLPSVLIKFFFYLVLILTCIVIAFGSYSSKIKVAGKVEPVFGSATIRAMHPGIVVEQYFRAGDLIAKGQRLYRINFNEYLPTGENPFFKWRDDLIHFKSELVAMSQSLDETEVKIRALYKSAIKGRKLDAAIHIEINNAISKMTQQKNELAEMYNVLGSESVISRAEQLDSLYQLENMKLTSSREALQQNEIEVNGYDRQRLYEQVLIDIKTARVALQSNLLDLENLFQQKLIQSDHLVISEIDAEILASNVSIGQSVISGDALLTYAPRGPGVVVEIYIPDRSMADISEGDKVSIRYSAYPREKYGQFSGTIARIASVPMQGSENAEPRFKARVALDNQFIHTSRGARALKVGQTVEATISIQEKKIIDWLIGYFHKNFEL